MTNQEASFCLQVSTPDGVLTLQTMPEDRQVYVRFTYDSRRKKPIETMIGFDEFQELAAALKK